MAVAELYPEATWRTLRLSLDRFSGPELGIRELWQIHLANTAFALECPWRQDRPPVRVTEGGEGEKILAALYNRVRRFVCMSPGTCPVYVFFCFLFSILSKSKRRFGVLISGAQGVFCVNPRCS